MKRYVIRHHGMLIGSFEAQDEAVALDAACQDRGFESFADACKKIPTRRDHFSVKTEAEEQAEVAGNLGKGGTPPTLLGFRSIDE